MGGWLDVVTEVAVVAIDLVAVAVIVLATLEAVIGIARIVATRAGLRERQAIWLRYARWLIAALTFQLAADILETAISTDWAAIARVGAIALIRTFLNYFLERDYAERGGLGDGT